MPKQTYENYYKSYFSGRGRSTRLAAQKRYRDKLKLEFPEATSWKQAAEMKRQKKLLEQGK